MGPTSQDCMRRPRWLVFSTRGLLASLVIMLAGQALAAPVRWSQPRPFDDRLAVPGGITWQDARCMIDAPLTALAAVLDPDPEHIDDLFGVRFGSPPPPSLERLGTQGLLTAYRLNPAPATVWSIPVKAVGFLYLPSAGGEALTHISLIAADGIAYARFLYLLQTRYGWPEHPGPRLVWRTATMMIAATVERGLHTIVFTRTPSHTPHAGIRGEPLRVSNRDENHNHAKRDH
jgi:hypothetical protein